jgi:hypothetical protein
MWVEGFSRSKIFGLISSGLQRPSSIYHLLIKFSISGRHPLERPQRPLGRFIRVENARWNWLLFRRFFVMGGNKLPGRGTWPRRVPSPASHDGTWRRRHLIRAVNSGPFIAATFHTPSRARRLPLRRCAEASYPAGCHQVSGRHQVPPVTERWVAGPLGREYYGKFLA